MHLLSFIIRSLNHSILEAFNGEYDNIASWRFGLVTGYPIDQAVNEPSPNSRSLH